MASTILTLNTETLSRAADEILRRSATMGGLPSKNAILNALAAAIAGPGHDWGFLKNAPQGAFVQPGLEIPGSNQGFATTVPAAAQDEVWIVQYDEREDWARAPRIFSSKGDALAFVASDHGWWRHGDHPFDKVMGTLANSGEYIFCDADEEDDTDGAQNPYMISVRTTRIETAPALEPSGDPVRPHCDILILTETPVIYREQGITWYESIFENLATLDAYAAEHNLDSDPEFVGWRNDLHRADACTLTATFKPEAWINDNAYEVDPQGETTWKIDADELEPDQSDLDYLRTSRNAPEWVRDWTGPFTVNLEIEAPQI